MIANTRVKNGYTKSCGCLKIDTKNNITHGMRGSPEYSSWQAMKARCHNPRNKSFTRYGGSGIAVCDEWKESFESFFFHIGPRPNGTSIDRIDPAHGYKPGNVRWATPKEQARNRRDLTIINTPLGEVPLVEYAARIGISRSAAHHRLKRNTLEGCSHV